MPYLDPAKARDASRERMRRMRARRAVDPLIERLERLADATGADVLTGERVKRLRALLRSAPPAVPRPRRTPAAVAVAVDPEQIDIEEAIAATLPPA